MWAVCVGFVSLLHQQCLLIREILTFIGQYNQKDMEKRGSINLFRIIDYDEERNSCRGFFRLIFHGGTSSSMLSAAVFRCNVSFALRDSKDSLSQMVRCRMWKKIEAVPHFSFAMGPWSSAA